MRLPLHIGDSALQGFRLPHLVQVQHNLTYDYSITKRAFQPSIGIFASRLRALCILSLI